MKIHLYNIIILALLVSFILAANGVSLAQTVALSTPQYGLSNNSASISSGGVSPQGDFLLYDSSRWLPLNVKSTSGEYENGTALVALSPNPYLSVNILQGASGVQRDISAVLAYQFIISGPQDIEIPINFHYNVTMHAAQSVPYYPQNPSEVGFTQYAIGIWSQVAHDSVLYPLNDDEYVFTSANGNFILNPNTGQNEAHPTGGFSTWGSGLGIWGVRMFPDLIQSYNPDPPDFRQSTDRNLSLVMPTNSIETVTMMIDVNDKQFGSEFASITSVITIGPDYLEQGYSLIESPGIGNDPNAHDLPNGIPEPCTVVLMGLGTAGAAIMRRRMRQA